MQHTGNRAKPGIVDNLFYIIVDKRRVKRVVVQNQHPQSAHDGKGLIFILRIPGRNTSLIFVCHWYRTMRIIRSLRAPTRSGPGLATAGSAMGEGLRASLAG